MNAIPLINNAPRLNINVGSIGSPTFNPVAAGAKLGGSIGGNVMRQNPASMPVNNETQLRQEVNTSIVALKREAFSLENLIAQAAQTLQDINKRLSELEGKQGDYVKKADATVESVGGNGKYISAISETDGKINATATDLGNMVPVNSVTSGNLHSVTSGAVYSALENRAKVRKSSLRSTIDEMLADLGLTDSYIKIAFNKLNTDINSYTTGFIPISTGGPAYCFILYKLTNGYYTAEFMSYDSAIGLNIIKFCKFSTGFQGIKYYI